MNHDRIATVNIWLATLVCVCSAMATCTDAFDHRPLWVLMLLTDIAVTVLSAMVATTYRDVRAGLRSDRLEVLERASRAAQRTTVLSLLQGWAIVAQGLAAAVSEALRGNWPQAIQQAIISLALLWLINRTGRSGRDQVKRLLGEKSKALRQKLVDSMPAPSPVTGAAGA